MTSRSHIDIRTRRRMRKAVRGAAIGNTVEWFDFAIYSCPGHLYRRQVLPVGQRHRRAAQHLRDLRRGLLHAAAGWLLLRAACGPNRPSAGARDRHPVDVGLDVRHRSGSELRRDRRGRSAAAAASSLPARLFGRRRVRQRRVLPRGVRTDKHRGFVVSFLVWSVVVGFLLGSITVTVLEAVLPEAAMDSYGWRIPFLLAGCARRCRPLHPATAA